MHLKTTRTMRLRKAETWMKIRIADALASMGRKQVSDARPTATFRVPRRIVAQFGSQTSVPLRNAANNLLGRMNADAHVTVGDRTRFGSRIVTVHPHIS